MDMQSPYCNPEIWGGIECTINRVGDKFRDQLEATGHYQRAGDIELIASLGISKLRYPILWEKHQPQAAMEIDWEWTSRQLNRIRAHHIIPIAGLLHHGSGPAFTNLLDPGLPAKFASYAEKVAETFPWLEYYTPVNEPLTTARFSGLYGFWYPHHRNELSFARILLNELKATVLAMQAIRRVNPEAKLVQTEDLAKTHSTRLLAYQAAFENKRRWLTYDLLCGQLNRKHFFWKHFLSVGIPETDLQFFLDNPCPPAIMGFNYYVTSERYIDEHVMNYPPSTHGGNERHCYADIEAVRSSKQISLESLLKEAWHRYHLPMAITECHLNCTREEQMRWLKDTWETACRLKKEKIDLVAVTAWSLLGAYDWNSLLICSNNHYEPGVFDIRSEKPRPTALAKQVRQLSDKGKFEHPLLNENGWWHKKNTSPAIINRDKPPLLIAGSHGTLGQAFLKTCERRSIPAIALSRQQMDISNPAQVREAIELYKPWCIINTAGYVKVDDAETHSDECFQSNAFGPATLAKLCSRTGIRLMSFSTDLVFDGTKQSPYHESDDVNPLNIYGSSKARGEELIMQADESALIIRSSAFFGPWDRYNFVFHVVDTLKQGLPMHVADDVMISPTYVPDLADAALDLLIDEEKGIWHLSNQGKLTWNEFALHIAERAGFRNDSIMARPLQEMALKAKRPLYSVLESNKGVKLPLLENALQRYFEDQYQ